MPITHLKTFAQGDEADETKFRPSDWGAEHVVSGITNAEMAAVPARTFKGNHTGGAAVPADITVAQAKALLAYTAGDVGADASGASAAAQAASQPLDAGLTAIAALTTTAYGRAFLALADGAALAALVDSFFLTPAEANLAYSAIAHTHPSSVGNFFV